MKSIALNDNTYWDATGVYDSTSHKTQRELNAQNDSAIAAKYTKPSTGIPKSDLAQGVRDSLDKADTALQQNQKGVASGVAELDANGKVPVAQCPIEEDVAQATTDWLDEHIAQETGYVLDDTLTVAGTAADSKKVGDELSDLKSAKAPVIIDTASGSIASFEDGADGMPLKSLTVNVEPVQAAGTPSPGNPLPISGWTGCNISHSGEDTSDPTITPISWQSEAGTVYGGTLAINEDGSGELTVETAFHTVNGSESWGKVTTGSAPFFQYERNIATSRAMFMSNPNVLKHSCCNIFPYKGISISNTEVGCCEIGSSNNTRINYVRVRTSADMSLADFKQILSENPMQIVYMLYTPISYPLTHQQVINTLLGTNNIWADCGDVSVDYPADTKLFIQKVNKPTDDDMTADAQIASGKYFIIGNNLYLSTTTIPAGDTIIPGTNCTKTDLAAALNALNA